VFTLSEANEVAAWNARDGARAWRLEKPGAWALDCTEAALVVTMATPSALSVDLASGAPGATLAGPSGELTRAGAVDPRGRWAWVGVQRGLVHLDPSAEGGWRAVELENGGVTALALDEAAARLAAGGQDGGVHLVDALTGEVDQRILKGSATPVTALAFAPKLLVVAAEDRTIRLWNPVGGTIRVQMNHGGEAVRVLTVAPKAGWIASGDGQGSVLLWQIARGTVLANWRDDLGGRVVALAFAADERSLLVAAGARVLALDLAGVK
jgi:WD40 repeat protein